MLSNNSNRWHIKKVLMNDYKNQRFVMSDFDLGGFQDGSVSNSQVKVISTEGA